MSLEPGESPHAREPELPGPASLLAGWTAASGAASSSGVCRDWTRHLSFLPAFPCSASSGAGSSSDRMCSDGQSPSCPVAGRSRDWATLGLGGPRMRLSPRVGGLGVP